MITNEKEKVIFKSSYEYDERGNTILDNNEISKIESKYNENNKLIWRKYEYKDGIGNIITDHEYDNNGNEIKITTTTDNEVYIFTKEYNDDNKIIKESTSRYDKSYIYDEKGRLIRVMDNDYISENYKYNDDGKVIYYSYGDIDYEEFHTYDDKGNEIEIHNSNGDKTEFIYDNNGNNIEVKEYYNDNLINNILYKYDDNNCIIEEIDNIQNDKISYFHNKDGLLLTAEYENSIQFYTYDGDKLINEKDLVYNESRQLVKIFNIYKEYNEDGKVTSITKTLINLKDEEKEE